MQWPETRQPSILRADKKTSPVPVGTGKRCERGLQVLLCFLHSPLDLLDEFTDVNRPEQNQFESAPAQESARDQVAAGDDPNGNLVRLLRELADFCFHVFACGEVCNNQSGQDLAEVLQSLACREIGLGVNSLFEQLRSHQCARLPLFANQNNRRHFWPAYQPHAYSRI